MSCKNWPFPAGKSSKVIRHTDHGSMRSKSAAESVMQRSKGNMIVFDEAAERVGSDTMRWLFANHIPEKNLHFPRIPTDEDMEKAAQTGLPVRLSEKWMLVRRTLDKIWNVYSFFVNYANIDRFDPTQHQLPTAERSELDHWILSELQMTIREVTEGLEHYDTVKPTAA